MSNAERAKRIAEQKQIEQLKAERDELLQYRQNIFDITNRAEQAEAELKAAQARAGAASSGVKYWKERAAQAEALLERVRVVAERSHVAGGAAAEILEILDGAK